MENNFGPFGWFKPSPEKVLENEAISWIEEEAMWQFLYNRIHNLKTRKVEKNLVNPGSLVTWEKFRVEKKSQRPLAKLRNHYVTCMAPNLYKAKMATEDKLKCFFGLNIPISAGFLDYLRKTSTVTLDSQGCITFYRYNVPGGLILGCNET